MEKPPKEKQLLEWHRRGCAYARLAAGGTPYLLLLIAGTAKVTEAGKLSIDALDALGNALRYPRGEENSGKCMPCRKRRNTQSTEHYVYTLIRGSLIPFLANLRQEVPFTMSIRRETLDATNLDLCDQAFDSLRQR